MRIARVNDALNSVCVEGAFHPTQIDATDFVDEPEAFVDESELSLVEFLEPLLWRSVTAS